MAKFKIGDKITYTPSGLYVYTIIGIGKFNYYVSYDNARSERLISFKDEDDYSLYLDKPKIGGKYKTQYDAIFEIIAINVKDENNKEYWCRGKNGYCLTYSHKELSKWTKSN